VIRFFQAHGWKGKTMTDASTDKPLPELDAFPAAMADIVRLVVTKLRPGQLCMPKVEFRVLSAGETLTIPYRVYYDRKVLLALARHREVGAIALALGTRHYDGYLREEFVRELMARDLAWSAPFIFQLLGEYVVEIALTIEQALEGRDRGSLLGFIRANPTFAETTARRATSYWDAYYRGRYRRLEDYPAFRVISRLCIEAGRPIEPALRQAARRKRRAP
jgi:hypothetical protein